MDDTMLQHLGPLPGSIPPMVDALPIARRSRRSKTEYSVAERRLCSSERRHETNGHVFGGHPGDSGGRPTALLRARPGETFSLGRHATILKSA